VKQSGGSENKKDWRKENETTKSSLEGKEKEVVHLRKVKEKTKEKR